MHRALTIVMLTAALFGVLLMAMRLIGSVSLDVPLHVVTSGWEQESLIAIYNNILGLPVYVSRYDMPFRWAIYNWFFYDSYSVITNAIMGLFELQTDWLPTVTRLITVAAMPIGALGAVIMFNNLISNRNQNLSMRIFIIAAGIYLFSGPLIGFWGMTTRADLWAGVIEVMGAGLFFLLYRRGKEWPAILAAVAFAYLAWSFKQSSVGLAGAIGMLLLFRRAWMMLFAFSALLISAWVVTLYIGSDIYRTSILLREYEGIWSLSHSLNVFVNAATKTVPFLAGAAITFCAILINKTIRAHAFADDVMMFALNGTVISTALAFFTGMQTGSAENYYFIPAFFWATLTVGGLNLLSEIETPVFRKILMPTVIASSLVQVAALIFVVGGSYGITSVRHTHEHMLAGQECLKDLPKPTYASDMYLSLPWMNSGSPAIILAFGYWQDRKRGAEFERGGVGGLIDEGYFASLFVPPGQDMVDGTMLDRYKVIGNCAGFEVRTRSQ